jgi:hypothetical protein
MWSEGQYATRGISRQTRPAISRLVMFRYLCDGSGNPRGIYVQSQIGLEDDSYHAIVAIHNWNASYLMLLHQPLAGLDIVVFAASDRLGCHEFLDHRLLGIQSLCYYGTA